ncbi:MAG: hypothetical protein M0D57_07195 [Sphingobacteriales bacterium JAD_PAG50586_3]|nr:MAG: hypothetical protein M0D57_07195 [Sphingobacteriales bacterium JAD_PAG50586_3]
MKKALLLLLFFALFNLGYAQQGYYSPKSPITGSNPSILQESSAKTTLKGVLSKSALFSDIDIQQLKVDVTKNNTSVDTSLSSLKNRITTLYLDKQELLKLQDINKLKDQIKSKEKSRDEIKTQTAKDLENISFKGLYAVVLNCDWQDAKEELGDKATSLLSPMAVSDLNGTFVSGLTYVKDAGVVTDYVKTVVSGKASVDKVHITRKIGNQSLYLLVATIDVSPLKTNSTVKTSALSAGTGSNATIINLIEHTDFKDKLAKAGVSPDEIKNIESEVIILTNNIKDSNLNSQRREKQIIEKGDNNYADLTREINDLNGQLKNRSKLIEDLVKSKTPIKFNPASPESSVKEAITYLDGQLDKYKKQMFAVKENEIIISNLNVNVTSEGKPNDDIVNTAWGLIEQLRKSYSKVENFLEETTVKDLSDVTVNTGQKKDIFRELDKVWLYPVAGNHDNFFITVIAKFKIKDDGRVKGSDLSNISSTSGTGTSTDTKPIVTPPSNTNNNNSGSSSSVISSSSFLDQVPTSYTGAKGTVTFDGGTLKTKTFNDVSPNLKKGAKIELLSTKMIKDNTSLNLNHVKVKIIDDLDGGQYNGMVGFMYPSSTSFGDMADYTSGKIDLNKTTTTSSSSGNILNLVPNVSTGITGKITFDGARFKITGFDDNNGNITEGAVFKLLNTEMVPDNSNLYNVKIEIISDKDGGKFKGKTGYVYAASTNLDVDYTTGMVTTQSSRTTTTTSNSSSGFADRLVTTNPGVYGKITFSPTAGFKQYSHDDVTRVNEGATFELLSRKLIKDNSDIYTIKVKIIDDNGSGVYNGKIGYVYPASTSLSDYVDYTAERIDGGPTSNSGSSSKSRSNSFLDQITSTYPGVYGKITFSPDAGFLQYSWDDNTRVKEGATFELLSREMAEDNSSLNRIKVKIIDDNGSGIYNGKIGYVYPASTSLTDYTNYSAKRIDGGPTSLRSIGGSSSGSSSSGSFQDQVKSTYPEHKRPYNLLAKRRVYGI